MNWTVMVFMGAATITGSEPLLDAADSDLAEMESVGSGRMGRDGGQLNVFVQEHGRDTGPRRGKVEKGRTAFEKVEGPAADPRRGRALAEFVLWSLGQVGQLPEGQQHHSLLVLWGHSYDFAFGRERTREGVIDALDFAELSNVLQHVRERLGSKVAKLDMVGFDACDLATVEAACQLGRFADYMVASEIGIPIPGWPYDSVLMGLRSPYGRVMGPAEFGSWIVRRFAESYSAATPAALSLLNLKRVDCLQAHAAVLAATLAMSAGDASFRNFLFDVFYQSQTDEGRPYVDVADLCLTLLRESSSPLVREAARAFGDFLLAPSHPLAGKSATGEGRPFVAELGRIGSITARLNGVSLYAPHLVRGRDFESPKTLYQQFDFVKDTQWSDVVHTLARLA